MASMDLHTRGQATVKGSHRHSEQVGKNACWLTVSVDGLELAIHFQDPSEIVNLGEAIMKQGKGLILQQMRNGEQAGPACQSPPASVYHGQQVQGHQPREEYATENVPQRETAPPDHGSFSDHFEETAEMLRQVGQKVAEAAGNLNVAAGGIAEAAQAVYGLARVL